MAPRAQLPPTGLIIAVAAALAIVGCVPSASAQAGCGGVQQAQPRKHHGHDLPPLAIGDSTMLLALPNLAKEGYQVDARGCRDFAEGLKLIRKRLAARSLPHLVVVALGADASISFRQVQLARHLVGPGRVLGLVTPRELGGGHGADARVVKQAGRRYPHRIDVLDWVGYSAGRASWFQPDGLHLTFSGAHGFARLLRQALPLAYPKPPVAPKPKPVPPAPSPAPTAPAPEA